jgi:hypothetical protein
LVLSRQRKTWNRPLALRGKNFQRAGKHFGSNFILARSGLFLFLNFGRIKVKAVLFKNFGFSNGENRQSVGC